MWAHTKWEQWNGCICNKIYFDATPVLLTRLFTREFLTEHSGNMCKIPAVLCAIIDAAQKTPTLYSSVSWQNAVPGLSTLQYWALCSD